MVDKEKPLKERPLLERIVIGICIFILIGLPTIVIIGSISVLVYSVVEERIAAKENRDKKRASNEELYGKYLYLDKIDEDVYEVVSEDEDPEKRLVWDAEFCGYYDDLTDSYVWYDENRKKWKYWFDGISSEYKGYGWMVYTPNGWRIDREDGDWIKLPEKYDRSRLWYIKLDE